MAASAPQTLAFTITGPIGRADLLGLYRRICALLRDARPDVVLADVRGVQTDAVTVEALARLQLAAHRHGCRVWLRSASPELVELCAFMGLADVLAECATPETPAAARTAGTASGYPGRT